MEITIQSAIKPKKLPQEQYQVKMETYWGDADGYKNYKFLVPADKIEQVMLEILFLEYQFEGGRGGCRNMYDQNTYFNGTAKTEGYFSWFENYPYDSNGEQNYSLDDYTITYFDKNSIEHTVSITKTEKIIEDIQTLNKTFKIDDYKEWDNLNSDDKKFLNYHQAVISYIDKYLLEQKIADNKQNKKEKLKV